MSLTVGVIILIIAGALNLAWVVIENCLGARRVSTQYENGTIKHVPVMTTVKSVGGLTTEYGVAYNIIQPQLADGMIAAQESIQIIFSEYIFVHLEDKCGNEVQVNYNGDFQANE